jgi:hypothetical protein
MLAGGDTMYWFKPGAADPGCPSPFLGIETGQDLADWPRLSVTGKCAMRWRGSVRAMARLRAVLPAEQLTTLRYEDLLRNPAAAAGSLSEFVGAAVAAVTLSPGHRDSEPGAAPGTWRRRLTPAQLTEIEQVAGTDLHRIGYGR